MKHNPVTPKQTDAQRILAQFVRASKHYRAVWGVPPGEAAFRSMWMAARSSPTTHAPAHPRRTQTQTSTQWMQTQIGE